MIETRQKLLKSFYDLLEELENVADGKKSNVSNELIELDCTGDGLRISIKINENGIKKDERLRIVRPDD